MITHTLVRIRTYSRDVHDVNQKKKKNGCDDKQVIVVGDKFTTLLTNTFVCSVDLLFILVYERVLNGHVSPHI